MSDVDTILKRLVADIDDAMEMQGTRWSSNERVAGLVQEALEQATRLIQVLYATEMSSLDQEIVSLKAKQPPVESLDSIEEIEQDFYKWLGWNAHDMGEMGRFIRVKYAKNWWSEKGRQQLERLIQTSNREAVRLGQVRCAAEMSNLDQEIMSLKAEIKRLQTLTKEVTND